ncbi:MAG: bifunctional 5,10-methylene-tetrahydrofolate dehydrogenase/5,10-methylene-tetrahydrofolate cyclohydrolase [Flavobacteriaceae bacterium]|jgi:methylenetetrahydrofolate dehydrogenase (NADP+)/methenyltetrahydrofolate cyclohydrolase|nr:bifunctional 5,10-methylene-tetrahydrofolate dehydrogenase/5,10-methylene-tetrahydrofolate cyclohydrolase [Flavobacteriaceae bacterium]MBT3753616.1 bifunctional 5,10-methylene-tetrahydrofolate dehydrogenase/5,10-methylene-tetrahydrofolate cyclohydrolase [Flavobacteriaceae bacterium]MBT3794008.1 bifunctional 5,10-methylene-tetrahydrofolate dehydrogenase/5,10-methylene-tetrahydrofolate cyclohydrolase [Flavobacteriaceae bacterium]MBT4062993.1 bifunctional 5,10-methylene-tetrahydrofolate dehydrog|tara:strand:- start:657 stop:1538 length:882 start_codon:yes stop_codon:yes gene_type:complete
MKIIDGKNISNLIKEEIKVEVDQIISNGERPPHLAAVLVGEDGASLTYVASKVRSCQQVGFNSTLVKLPVDILEKELLKKIQELNNDDNIDGFIVQLPLPDHIDEEKILLAINPNKDVDGFHPTNFGKMALNMKTFIPATPFGIMELLKRYDIETKGKYTVVIGRSHIVGRPISILMNSKGNPGDSTVTVVHSRTKNIENYTKNADIIISALGIPGFVKNEMVKDGVVVIDVGITRVKDSNHPKGYVIRGDVDFDSVKQKASYITPVPGGVGPMTIAMLLKNTLLSRSLLKNY